MKVVSTPIMVRNGATLTVDSLEALIILGALFAAGFLGRILKF